MFHWMSCRTRVSVASLWARSNLIGQSSRRRQTEAYMSCENQNQLTRSLQLSRRKLQLFITATQVVSRPPFNHAAPTFVSAEILSKFSELQLTGQYTARQTSLSLVGGLRLALLLVFTVYLSLQLYLFIDSGRGRLHISQWNHLAGSWDCAGCWNTAKRCSFSPQKELEFIDSTTQRLDDSTTQRLDDSTTRRLDDSSVHRLDDSFGEG